MSKPLPSPDILRAFLRYDAQTGKLFWNTREPGDFISGRRTAIHMCNHWNARWAGKEAMTAINGEGYHTGTVSWVQMLAHRAIWAMVHGEWPNGEIDHINGDTTDNRIANLRSVTAEENRHNMAKARNNTSGTTGVSWSRGSRKWKAQICASRHQRHLGFYDSKDEAIAARKLAERLHGFHENHGRLAVGDR